MLFSQRIPWKRKDTSYKSDQGVKLEQTGEDSRFSELNIQLRTEAKKAEHKGKSEVAEFHRTLRQRCYQLYSKPWIVLHQHTECGK